MKIGFEVLHYQSIEDTINCVNSILRNIPSAIITIVDNNSPNQSGEELTHIYNGNKQVHCILLKENFGFAGGNNAGYKWLRDNYSFDFICCINNDTLVKYDFTEILEKEYINSKFDILAPLVKLKDGSIQSFNPTLHDLDYYKNELDLWKINKTIDEYARSKDLLTRLLLKHPVAAAHARKIKQKVRCSYKNRMEDVVLHGCFLIFSRKYIDLFETAFDPRTFMYREEELLFLRVIRNGLKTVYSTDFEIVHLEDSATNSVYKNSSEKYLFMRKNQILSLNIILDELTSV